MDEQEAARQSNISSMRSHAGDIISDIDALISVVQVLAGEINRGIGGREVALCITKLEEARHRMQDARSLIERQSNGVEN